MFFKKKLILCLLLLAQISLNAQDVSFNVMGSNPRCQSDFPNGVPYNGSVGMPSVASKILSVKLAIQYKNNSDSFWKSEGTLFTFVLNALPAPMLYSNWSTGAPKLTSIAGDSVRMVAIIRFRTTKSSQVMQRTTVSIPVAYSYVYAPSTDFGIKDYITPNSPAVTNVLLGTEDIILKNTSTVDGTGITWRLSMFRSTASGVEGVPFDINGCGWKAGLPPVMLNLSNPQSDPSLGDCPLQPPVFSDSGEYCLVRLEIQNDCGISTKRALLYLSPQLSVNSVNLANNGGEKKWLPTAGNDIGDFAETERSETFQVVPNPTSDLINLAIESNDAADAEIRILDMQGQIIKYGSTQTLNLNKGNNSFYSDISHLSAGTFIIQIVKPSGILTQKIIKI